MNRDLYSAKGFSPLLLAFAMCLALAPAVAAHAQQTAQSAVRPDADVQADVVAAITNSPVLNVQPITASTVAGQVTLSGSVDDNASKDLAEITVKKVSGVRTVVNNLEIVPMGAPDAAEAGTDGQQPAQQSAGQEPVPPVSSSPSTATAPPPSYGAPQYPQPPQNQYPQRQYPSGRPLPSGPILIPQGTLLNVRLSEPLDSHRAGEGAFFQATSASDIYVGGVLAIPRGATLQGQVVHAESAKGSLGGNSTLALRLNNLVLEGHTYPLNTDIWVGNSHGKGAYSAGNTITGASIGAIIGGIAGGGAGAAVGAAIGGATGAVASSASSGPRVILPPEMVLPFHLVGPVTVDPVSYQEAQRLAGSQPQGGPYLERRPSYPPPAYAAPVAVYAYPYVSPYPNAYPYAYRYPYAYPPYRYGYYPRYRVYRHY